MHTLRNGVDVFSDGTTVLCASNNGSIYRSPDEGETWQYVSKLPFRIPWTLFIDSRDYVFTCSLWDEGAGLYRSVDRGLTWEKVWAGLRPESKVAPEGISEDDQGNLYIGSYLAVGGESTVWKSLDGGDTWTLIFNTNDYAQSKHIHHLKFSPHTKCLYVEVSKIPETDGGWEFVSSDYGNTWQMIVDFDNPTAIGFFNNHVYVGGYYLAQRFDEITGDNLKTIIQTYGGIDAQFFWWFRTSPSGHILLGSGGINTNKNGVCGVQVSTTGDPDSWEYVIMELQSEMAFDTQGYMRASHKWSKSGWLFVTKLMGKGTIIRIRYGRT
jgi:hypothetical protein